MNTREVVMLNSDTNYIPVKYAVMEVSVGSTLAASYVWLKCISGGVALEADFDALKASLNAGSTPDYTKMLGTIGAYSVAALSTIKEYKSPASFSGGNLLLG
jgi:hypothetical protein